MYCDLHVHSTASDGTDRPEALPSLAKQAGLDAFALTDHDTTSGLAACRAAAEQLRIAFVPGIELSADPSFIAYNDDPDDEQDLAHGQAIRLHILGYFIDDQASHLKTLQDRLVKARADRNPRMILRLNELGVKIDYREVLEVAGSVGDNEASNTIIGRPHIAQVLVNKGYVKSIHEAFIRYIGSGGVAYVSKDRLDVEEAITAIRDAGGLACLAHPVQLGITEPAELEHLIARLVDLGLDGIETIHSDHKPRDIQLFEKLAGRFNLLKTGGSDYHGSRKSIRIGTPHIPYNFYQSLYAAWEKHIGRNPSGNGR